MSETQWSHTLHLSPNPRKTVCSCFQIRVSGLACNGYISKIGCFDSKTGCSDFYWLVSNDKFLGDSIKASPTFLLWGLLLPPTKILFLKPLRPLPFTSKWGLSDLWEIQAKSWVRSSLWTLEHLSFVKQSLWHLLLLEVKPPRWLGVALELPRLWWAVGKFVNVRFTSERKEARASEVRKAVERDPAWSLHLVGNSSYLNGDVGITGGDSKLR
jgi:hypothetical protein